MYRLAAVAFLSMLLTVAAAVHTPLGEAQPAPTAAAPSLTLKVNRFAFEEGLTYALSAGVSAGSPVTGDLYVVLRAPDGRLFSLLGSGGFGPGLVPLASNVSLPAGFEFSPQAILLGRLPALPPGPYTWFGAFTAPGTLDLVSNLARADFHFLPSTDAEAEVVLENGFRVRFLGVTNNPDGTSTWRYYVEELVASQDLSNWVLELPACATVLGAAPEPWELVHPDPNAGLHGIKWQTGAGFVAGEFAFMLSAQWPVGPMRVAAKGPDVAWGTILGPSCQEPLELALNKVADTSSANPGDEVTYTITLENVGTAGAVALVLTDSIPLGTTFVDGSLHVSTGFGQFRSDATGENLVFWQGDLAPGEVLTVSFRVTVQLGVAHGSTIRNTVVAGPEQATVDITVP